MKLNTVYDIVILGGGPAGLSAAIALLHKLDLSILIVEAQTADQERIGESCPPDTLLLLKQLQLSKEFHQGGHAPCPGYASVWGNPNVGYNDFIVNPMGPAWRLNRRAFDEMLADKAILEGAQLARPFRFLNAQKTTADAVGYQLTLVDSLTKEQHQVNARFVIDATGSKARFATVIGVKRQVEDQLFAQVRFAQVSAGSITKQVLLEATPDGWWYTALLPQNRIVSMAVAEKDTLTTLQHDNQQGFETALQNTSFIGPVLEKLSLTDKHFHTWPIYSSLLSQLEGEDWLAIGDAASCYDPIAAQGIHKALTHGIMAVDKVVSFFEQGDYQAGSFTDNVQKRFAVYRQNRDYSYGLERRWEGEVFWRNRHTSGSHKR